MCIFTLQINSPNIAFLKKDINWLRTGMSAGAQSKSFSSSVVAHLNVLCSRSTRLPDFNRTMKGIRLMVKMSEVLYLITGHDITKCPQCKTGRMIVVAVGDTDGS